MNRNINYVLAKLVIIFKQIREYKLNLYFGFIANFCFMFVFITFLYVVKLNFSNIFYWDLEDFCFFAIFIEIVVFVFHPLYAKDLSRILISGDFSIYRVRPINSFIQYTMYSTDFFAIIISLFYILLLILYLTFVLDSFSTLRLLITFLFASLGGIFYLSVVIFTRNISFFMKKSKFLFKSFKRTENVFFMYPPAFFDKGILSYFIVLLPVTYYGSYSTEYFMGYINLNELISFSYPLIILTVFFLSLSYLLWHFGVKKYEAYS